MKLYSVCGQIYRQYTACKTNVRLQRTREYRRQCYFSPLDYYGLHSIMNQQHNDRKKSNEDVDIVVTRQCNFSSLDHCGLPSIRITINRTSTVGTTTNASHQSCMFIHCIYIVCNNLVKMACEIIIIAIPCS